MKCAECGAELEWDGAFCRGCGAPRPTLEPAFARVEQAYARLRRQYEEGTLPAEQFQAAVEAEMVDHGGRYWVVGVESGAWHAHDGERWTRTDPPVLPVAGAAVRAPSIARADLAPAPAPVRPGSRTFRILAAIGFAAAAIATFLPVQSGAAFDLQTQTYGARSSFSMWSPSPRFPLEGLLGTSQRVDAAFVLLVAAAGIALQRLRVVGAHRPWVAAGMGMLLATAGAVTLLAMEGGGFDMEVVTWEPFVVRTYGIARPGVGAFLILAGGLVGGVFSFLGRDRAA